jgi:hypothetical protein
MFDLTDLQQKRLDVVNGLNAFETKEIEIYGELRQLEAAMDNGQPTAEIESTIQSSVDEMNNLFDTLTTRLNALDNLYDQTPGTVHKRWISDDLRHTKLRRHLISERLNDSLINFKSAARMADITLL